MAEIEYSGIKIDITYVSTIHQNWPIKRAKTTFAPKKAKKMKNCG